MRADRSAVEHAKPKIPGLKPRMSDTEMVSITRTQVTKAEQHPDYKTTPRILEAMTKWSSTADAIEAEDAEILSLAAALDKARGAQALNLRTWDIDKHMVLAAVDDTCKGSKDAIQSWGLEAAERATSTPHLPPADFRAMTTDVFGQAAVQWTIDPHVPAYLLQWATDKNNPATHSELIACTQSKFRLAGQPSGTTLYFRIQAIDGKVEGGRSEFGPWVPVVVA